MVMQFGSPIPTPKKSDDEHYPTTPWKYILIAVILAASILGIFFAATTGIFSNSPTPAASTNPISGAPQPATNPIVFTDNEKDNRITKATKIPNPNEIMPYKTLIDISNPPEFIQTSFYGLVITDIEIDKKSDKIKGNFVNINPEKNFEVQPITIFFFSTTNKYSGQIGQEQWYCQYNDYQKESEYKYGKVHAHCQWPEDFCYMSISTEDRKKVWERYWIEKLGKKQQQLKKAGSTKYETIIPTLKPGKKYSFTITCEIPQDTKYIKIQ